MNKSSNGKKRLIIVLLITVLIIVAYLMVSNANKHSRELKNLNLGKECYSNEEYQNAIDYFNLVLKDNDKNVDAYYFKTNALMQLHDNGSAISVAEFGYKMTNDTQLKELKDTIVPKEDTGIVVTQQSVVSNSVVSSIYTTKATTKDIVHTVSSNSNAIVDLTPKVDVPESIPTVTTTETTLESTSEGEDSQKDSSNGEDSQGSSVDNPKDTTNSNGDTVVTTVPNDTSNSNGSNTEVTTTIDSNISDTQTGNTTVVNIDVNVNIDQELLNQLIQKFIDTIDKFING